MEHIKAKHLVFLVRAANVPALHLIADHVQTLFQSKSSTHLNVHVLLLPRRTMLAERIFEERGMLGQITMTPVLIDLVPIDRDVLSLDYPMDTLDLLHGDVTVVHQLATGLHRLQKAIGVAPKLHAYGQHAIVHYCSLFSP